MSTTTPICPLRRRMIEDMTVRGFGEETQSDYIRHVKHFTIFLGRSPDTAEGEDLRAFQVRQREQGVQPPTMNGAVTALRFSPIHAPPPPTVFPTPLNVGSANLFLAQEPRANGMSQNNQRHFVRLRTVRLRLPYVSSATNPKKVPVRSVERKSFGLHSALLA